MKRTLSLVGLLLTLSVPLLAQGVLPVSPLLSFQGRIAKPDGTPVADNISTVPYTIRFSLYDAASGGNVKWTQTVTGINVRNGVFTALLNLGTEYATILNGDLYMEIKVGNDAPLSPRQPVLATAFALKANTVPDNAITTAKIADGAITAAKLAPGLSLGASGAAGGDLTGTFPNPFIASNAVTTPKIANASVTLAKLAPSVGVVPPGYRIIGDTPTPPTNYAFNGETIRIPQAWNTQTSLPQPRHTPASAVFNGKIYVFGGSNGSSAVNTNYCYDPDTGTWTTRTPMPTARVGATAAMVNGKIYVFGGQNGSSFLNTHEVYDPITDTWSSKEPFPIAAVEMGVAVYNNQIFAFGGFNGSILATTYVYNIATNAWSQRSSIPGERDYPATVTIGQSIYVIGGTSSWASGGIFSNTNYVYDIASNTWTSRQPMPTARGGAACAVVYGKIAVIGGISAGGPAQSANEEYDPVMNTWRTRTPLPTARWSMAVGVINNDIYMIGGYNGDPSGAALAVNEVYTPQKTYFLFTKQ